MKPFDSSGAFFSPVSGDGLRRAAVRSAAVTVFAQVAGFLVQMVATMVLARILVPSDFGVVTMVTTFSVLLVSCGQIGFQEAVVQREEITHSLASNLYWLNVGIATVLTVVFAGAGSLLAKFYGNPLVTKVAAGMSLTILLTSLSVTHLALMKRAMRFSAVSANDIVARAVSVLISIFLGWRGWGYWALVAGAVAQPLSTSVGAWILCPWFPGRPRRVAGTGSVVSFAKSVYGRFSIDYFGRNMDNLLVGWRFGSGSLGYYKKAYDLFALPSNQLLSVYSVAVSTLSRLTKDREQYRKYFLGGLSVLAFIGMGIGAEFTLVGKDLIRLVLGAKWDEAGHIITFFGPGIGIMLIYGTHGIMHLSIGTPGRWFRWGIVEFAVTGGLFLLALRWGPVGMATAWTGSFCILLVPAFWYAGQPIGFSVRYVLGAIWRYFVASVMACVAGFICLRFMPSLAAAPGAAGAFERIVVVSLLLGAFYAAAIAMLFGSFTPFHQLWKLGLELAPWKRFTRPASVPVKDAVEMAVTASGE